MKFETLAVHAGREPDPATGAVREPIHLSTTFERAPDGSYPHGHTYTRAGNPNRASLERAIAALETGGLEALAWSSGSAATLAAFELVPPGGRIVCSSDCYHGTAKQLRTLLPARGVTAEFVDTADTDAVARALEPPTTMVWVETPSNPLLRVSDLAAIAELAHARGALLACDNTFASPVLQQPFVHGADLVMHSTTKYLGGHSDVLGGVLVVREPGAALERLRDYQATAGAVPSPFDCWMVLRSLPTLPLRVRAQAATALAVARHLAGHLAVARVHYPGLEDHPGHALAARQMHGGYGSVVSLQVRGGAAAAMAVAGRARVFTRATSLGGVESLIEHRASMEGPHTRTPQDLLRLSIGLEHADDLIADLDAALGG